jgi:hypothetical protein
LNRIDQYRLLLTLSVIDVETGEIKEDVGTMECRSDEFWRAREELQRSLFAALQIFPTDRERAEMDTRPQRDLATILAYGRGLLAERQGSLSEAQTSYEKALALDAGFGYASEALASLPEPSSSFEDLLAQGRALGEQVEPTSVQGGARLTKTDALTRSAFWPGDPEGGNTTLDLFSTEGGLPTPPTLPDH